MQELNRVIFTARKISFGKVMFLHLSVILFTGEGVSLTQTPPGQRSPLWTETSSLMLLECFIFISSNDKLLPPVFTGVCHSVHRGVVRGCSWGACVVAPGGMRGYSWGGMRGCSGGVCVVAPRGVRGCSQGGHVWLPGGVCMVAPGGCAWLLGGACVVFPMRYGQ